MSFTVQKKSLNDWNLFFSTEVTINQPIQLKLLFENPKGCDIKLYKLINLKGINTKDKSQQADIQNIIKSTSLNSVSTFIESFSLKSKPNEIVNCISNQITTTDGITSISLTLTFLIPFQKLDLLLCFISQTTDTLCVIPLKGLTSFDLLAKKEDIVECSDGTEKLRLERKLTTSTIKLLKNLNQSVIVCEIDGNSADEKKLFEKQVKIHQSLRCIQISSFMYSVPEINTLIFEKPRYWTLTDYLITNDEINRALMYKFCLDVSKAMDYLQQSQIVHRDLSTDSVFVFSVDPTDYVNCKLGNICCCERVSEYGVDATVTKPIYSNQGENFRMPPEITSKDASYTSECDIYSYGVLVFHVLTQLVNTNPIGESGCVLPQFTRQIPSALVNIINNCCSINPEERPSFSEIAQRINIISQKVRPKKSEQDMNYSNKQGKKQKAVKFPFV